MNETKDATRSVPPGVRLLKAAVFPFPDIGGTRHDEHTRPTPESPSTLWYGFTPKGEIVIFIRNRKGAFALSKDEPPDWDQLDWLLPVTKTACDKWYFLAARLRLCEMAANACLRRANTVDDPRPWEEWAVWFDNARILLQADVTAQSNKQPMDWPSASDIAKEIASKIAWANRPDSGCAQLDVRLQVLETGKWAVYAHHGDLPGDADCRGYWGTKTLPLPAGEAEIRDAAKAVLEKAMEHFAQSR